ncbi:MAG: site-specific integrase, partial [Polyangiaceae bacterium]
WHDLRHTCASALVSGMWGRAWRLEEICALLGHSSITVTQRYAHLAGTALVVAAEETSGRWYATGTEGTKMPIYAMKTGRFGGVVDPAVAGSSPVGHPKVFTAFSPLGRRVGALRSPYLS